jgi:hypothetical protein
MSEAKKCVRCQGEVFEEGAVQSSGSVSFRPKATRFLTLVPGNIDVSAKICMGCGLIELSGRTDKVQSLTKSA